jgi:hypothetical protein
MRAVLIVFLMTLVTSIGVTISFADEKQYGSFILNDDIPDTLFFIDEIKPNDSFELRKALRNHEIKNIVLASPGGSVWEGLQMAGIIFDKELRTIVPRGGSCQSACAFLFFAGSERLIEGELGVHQAYSSDFEKKQAVGQTQYVTQFTVSEIIGFLNEFGTPAFVYERMFEDIEMYFFRPKEVVELNSDDFTLTHSEKVIITRAAIELKKRSKLDHSEEKEPELSEKELIALIQKKLKEIGCNPGLADGIWGKRTQSAAISFAKTAGLSTDPEQLLSEAFFNKLAEAPPNFCPKPVKKKNPASKLAGNWVTAANCNHLGLGNINGNARVTVYKAGAKGTDYNVKYTNNLGQSAKGSLMHYSKDDAIYIYLDFGQNGEVTANLKKSQGIYAGTDSNGCPFIAYKK